MGNDNLKPCRLRQKKKNNSDSKEESAAFFLGSKCKLSSRAATDREKNLIACSRVFYITLCKRFSQLPLLIKICVLLLCVSCFGAGYFLYFVRTPLTTYHRLVNEEFVLKKELFLRNQEYIKWQKMFSNTMQFNQKNNFHISLSQIPHIENKMMNKVINFFISNNIKILSITPENANTNNRVYIRYFKISARGNNETLLQILQMMNQYSIYIWPIRFQLEEGKLDATIAAMEL